MRSIFLTPILAAAVLAAAGLFSCSCGRVDPSGGGDPGSGRTILIGGDISELSYVEQNGGKYYWNGQAGDCV